MDDIQLAQIALQLAEKSELIHAKKKALYHGKEVEKKLIEKHSGPIIKKVATVEAELKKKIAESDATLAKKLQDADDKEAHRRKKKSIDSDILNTKQLTNGALARAMIDRRSDAITTNSPTVAVSTGGLYTFGTQRPTITRLQNQGILEYGDDSYPLDTEAKRIIFLKHKLEPSDIAILRDDPDAVELYISKLDNLAPTGNGMKYYSRFQKIRAISKIPTIGDSDAGEAKAGEMVGNGLMHDSDSLCKKLELHVASKRAGNNSSMVDDNINTILDELLHRGHIQKHEHKKLWYKFIDI